MDTEHDQGTRDYASPPCYQHELAAPPTLTADEVAAVLNELLEGERAGARGLRDIGASGRDELDDVLRDVGRDEARYCGMLARQLARLGYPASRRTGAFYEKLSLREGLQAKLKLLDRGQSAVVRMLDDLLPAIDDVVLHADLLEMRDTHVRNIEACAGFIED